MVVRPPACRPGDLANGEHETFGHASGSSDDDHLVRLGSCTHTPYLARHCRRKQVGSLSWGIPTVVDYRQTGAQTMNLMVTQGTDKDFIQVRPPCGRNTYVLRLIVLLFVGLNCLRGVPCLSFYSPEGKFKDLETNPSRLQLPKIMR